MMGCGAMEDLLPGITCKVDVPVRTFLSRMEKIALQTKAFKVELHENIPGFEGFQSLAVCRGDVDSYGALFLI